MKAAIFKTISCLDCICKSVTSFPAALGAEGGGQLWVAARQKRQRRSWSLKKRVEE